jgi:endonuclease V-like protein UPF0215 family
MSICLDSLGTRDTNKFTMRISKGIRAIGLDDGIFSTKAGSRVLVAGPIMDGNQRLLGLLSTQISKDGFNATDKLIEMITSSKFYPQLHVIMTKGIALGGFNLLGLDRLYDECALPVLVVMRKKPRLNAMRTALEHLSQTRRRQDLLTRAGTIQTIGPLFTQSRGLTGKQIHQILSIFCREGHIPEPVRVAHLIASGISAGQSTPRA